MSEKKVGYFCICHSLTFSNASPLSEDIEGPDHISIGNYCSYFTGKDDRSNIRYYLSTF